MASAKQGFYYFGICPFLSSENVLARFGLGVTNAPISSQEIVEMIALKLNEGVGQFIIPSHFWWRADARELLAQLTHVASRIWIQCGPGFELVQKYGSVRNALELGFGVQIVCQKRLSYSQEHSISDLLNLGSKVQINFFAEESGDPAGDLRFFCDQYLSRLTITLSKYSFGLLAELGMNQPKIKSLQFFDFSMQKNFSYDQAIEQTSYAKRTRSFRVKPVHFPLRILIRSVTKTLSFIFFPKIEKFRILFNSIQNVLISAYHFLKLSWTKAYWPSRSSTLETISNAKLIAIKTYWISRSYSLEFFGLSRALSVKAYWLTIAYPLWPMRKIYWIVKFQYKKRIQKRHEN